MKFEVRGSTPEINEFMVGRAMKVVEGAAAMTDVKVSVTTAGECIAVDVDPDAMALVREAAGQVPAITKVLDTVSMGGGAEDCTFFMKRVKANGGKATIMILGTDGKAVPHNSYFDVDEAALPIAVQLLSAVTVRALHKEA
jgi:aminobenzoyl-glutamate utilization protein A